MVVNRVLLPPPPPAADDTHLLRFLALTPCKPAVSLHESDSSSHVCEPMRCMDHAPRQQTFDVSNDTLILCFNATSTAKWLGFSCYYLGQDIPNDPPF